MQIVKLTNKNPATIAVIYVNCQSLTSMFALFLHTAWNGVASRLLDEHNTATGIEDSVDPLSSFNMSSLDTNFSII